MSQLTSLLVTSVNFNKKWGLGHLSGKALNFLGCSVEGLVDLNQSLVELHQAVEGANLEALLLNL